MRVANRFLAIASLALAVLAGMGWASMRRRRDGTFLLLGALVILEYLWLPFPTRKVELSPYYERLARESGAGAVLDIPFSADPRSVNNMLAQTVHGRKIAGGYLSTTPPEALAAIRDDPTLSRLEGFNPSFRRGVDAARLRSLGFERAILHKYRARASLLERQAASDPRDLFHRKILSHDRGLTDRTIAEARRAFEAACGAPVYEDEWLVVFDLAPAPAARE
jgi:hypothetical protein